MLPSGRVGYFHRYACTQAGVEGAVVCLASDGVQTQTSLRSFLTGRPIGDGWLGGE